MPFLVAMYTVYSKSICFVTSRSHFQWPLKYSNVFTSIYDFLHRAQPSKHILLCSFSQMEDWRLVHFKFVCFDREIRKCFNMMCVCVP